MQDIGIFLTGLGLSARGGGSGGGSGPNINRGLFKAKLATGNARMLVIGDSIHNPYVDNRVVEAICKRWPVNKLFGAMSGFVANGDTGWPISNYPATGTNITQELGPAGSGLRPGDAFTDGTTGHNLLRTIPHRYTGNYVSQGTVGQGLVYPSNAYNVDWDSGENLKITLLLRTSTLAPTNHRIWGRARGSGSQSDVGNTVFNPSLSAPSYQSFTHTFARGTGSTYTTYTQLRSFTETELNGWHVDYLAMSVELATPPASGGLFMGYAGEGGYSTKSHLAVGEVINVGGFGAYTTYYSDAALDAHLSLFQFNVFYLYLGQNPAADEGSGGTIGNYKNNILAIIARYKDACARVGISNPTFILVSLYPTNTDNTRSINIAAALREIALADATVEFIDLRRYVVDTYGNYSVWQATFCPDLYHPSLTFSNIIADYVWASL